MIMQSARSRWCETLGEMFCVLWQIYYEEKKGVEAEICALKGALKTCQLKNGKANLLIILFKSAHMC